MPTTREKSTVYLEADLKQEVQVKLIIEGEKRSLSDLINELLEQWNKTH